MADDFDDMSAGYRGRDEGVTRQLRRSPQSRSCPMIQKETPEQTEAAFATKNGRRPRPRKMQDASASGEEPAKTILPRSWTAAAGQSSLNSTPMFSREVLRQESD